MTIDNAIDSFDALILSRNYIVAKRKRPPILIEEWIREDRDLNQLINKRSSYMYAFFLIITFKKYITKSN